MGIDIDIEAIVDRGTRSLEQALKQSVGETSWLNDTNELKLHVRENLAHFKTPQWVSFVEDLPKTATGKVQKFQLRGGHAGIVRQ